MGSGEAVYGFAGAQTGVGGLLYLDGRYYDPATGRFLSPDNNFDPMRPGTLNGYLASIIMANPGALLFGPLLILNWRRRKRRKGKYDHLLLLVVGIGLGVTLVSCRQEQEEETSAPTEPAPIQPTPSPEPTDPEPIEPEPPTGTPPPTNTPLPIPTATVTPCPTPTDIPLPTPTSPPYPLLPATSPTGLDIYGQAAWNGLVTIQAEKSAWWGSELDAREAMIIFINHEFGNLYGADNTTPNSLPPVTINATANRYDTFCAGGPWSSLCVDDFWGYSQVIRKPNTNLYSTYSGRGYLANYLANTSHNILAHNASSDKAPFHWANNYDDHTSTVAYTEWKAGDRTYLEWVFDYRTDGEITSIFGVQTTEQHNRTDRLDLWRR